MAALPTPTSRWRTEQLLHSFPDRVRSPTAKMSTSPAPTSTSAKRITSTTPTGGSTAASTPPATCLLALSNAGPANPENAPIQRFNWEHTLNNTMTNHFSFGYLNRNEGYYQLTASTLPKVPGVASTEGHAGHVLQQLHGAGQYGSGQFGDDVTTRGTYGLNDVFTAGLRQAHAEGRIRVEEGRHQHP
jgi:hypothetical protein